MKNALARIVCFLASGALCAQANTTRNTAAGVAWGQTVMSRVRGAPATEFWFVNTAKSGRSYCVETGNIQNGALAFNIPDTVLEIIHLNGTLITVNDDASDEPGSGNTFFSRACWIQSGDEAVFTRLTANNAGVLDTLISVRFIDTTLFCPWYFIAGDYNAFSLLRNTTNETLSGVKVTWFGLTGAVAGQTTVSIPANGTLIVNARDFVNPSAFSNGSIEIAHRSSPEAIVASTTTLSGTTGIGFDAAFDQRKTW